MKVQSLSKYFEIVKSQYIYLKITPDNSIRNYNSSGIAKAIHFMGAGINQRIERIEKKFIYKSSVKCSYIIDITKYSVDFILMVPVQYKSISKEKIRETWPKCKVTEIEGIPTLSEHTRAYQLYYKNVDALSLDIDKTNNEPLNHLLNVLEIMEETDRITLAYNFMPVSQYAWGADYDNYMENINNGQGIARTLTVAKIARLGIFTLSYVFETVFGALGEIFGDKKDNADALNNIKTLLGLMNKQNDFSSATRNKRNDTVIQTQLLVLSSGKNKEVNALSVCQSYKSIENDNILVYKPLNKPINIEKYNWKSLKNTMSISECKNLIQLPGRALLDEFKQIEKIDTLESQVPEQLSKGIIRLGVSHYRGTESKVFTTEDKELRNTAICICGPNRSGKSTLIANNVYDLIKAGRTVVLPDFCGKCQLSDELSQVLPQKDIININCADWNNLQGFGWNEIVPINNTPFELYKTAKMKASKLKELINLINDGNSDLEGRMERYLEYAALIVFICGGSVNEVFKTLKDHNLRHKYILSIPDCLKSELMEYIQELLELNEVDKNGLPIGTKQSYITAVLSRVHRLKENAYIEMMLKKDELNNINLVNELQQGKLICLKMYDSMFGTQAEKDIYVSYWLTKVWGALQQRLCSSTTTELTQVVLLIDELYQCKNAERYLTTILSQMPKYRAKLVLSCHHLAQVNTIQEELKSAMCSYIFLRGSNKKNYFALKEEFEDKGYSLEDMLHLKRYHALCLLAYEEGYWCGISQLPLPVK